MRLHDLTGQKFGMLTVLGRAENSITPNGTKRVMWRCKCDCGNECVRSSPNLKKRDGTSCGCRRAEIISNLRLEDLTGQRFGRLTVIERAPSNTQTRWKCRCDCGNEVSVLANNLKRGHTISCGCYREESRVKVKTTHGYTHTRIYGVWGKIKGRCYQKNNPSYPRYGGRGITMCDEWRDHPESFIKWAYENGYDENAEYGECTVDRIDNNKGYSPENCRIVDMKTQSNNRRSNLWIEHNGESKTLSQWADTFGTDPMRLRYYLVDRGMTIQEALDKGIVTQKAS